MAKVTKTKARVITKHSRAARRAASPSIDTDKSLKDVKPPEEVIPPPEVLAMRKGSGVSKKQKAKPLTRQQRLRREKGIQRGEAVVDKTEIKVAKSKDSARNIKSRAATWDELNGEKKTKKQRQAERKAAAEADGWEDQQDDAMEDVTEEPSMMTDADASLVQDPEAALVLPEDDDVDQIT